MHRIYGIIFLEGRVLVTLWSIFGVCITLFYQSNLRASLMTPQYENAIETHEDVIQRGQTVYMVEIVYEIMFG